jgi:hypothetical protein
VSVRFIFEVMTISSFIKYWLCFILFKDRPRTRQSSNTRRDVQYVAPEPMSVDEDPQADVDLIILFSYIYLSYLRLICWQSVCIYNEPAATLRYEQYPGTVEYPNKMSLSSGSTSAWFNLHLNRRRISTLNVSSKCRHLFQTLWTCCKSKYHTIMTTTIPS